MRRCQALAGDQEEGLHQNSPALILDFPASKTERNKFPLFIKRVMGGRSHSRYVVKEMKGPNMFVPHKISIFEKADER